MDMNGQERIAAPREAVWRALNDPDVLRQCIPGCQSLEKTSDTDMVAEVTLKIGPVSARFSGSVKLSDLNPPESYTITGEGKGGPAGFARGSATVRLRPDGKLATLLDYSVKAEIGGKLAQIGGRLIDAAANKLAGEFFSKFGEVVGKAEAPAEAIAVAAAGPDAPALQAFPRKLVIVAVAAAIGAAILFALAR
jgi:uncharacterized protein